MQETELKRLRTNLQEKRVQLIAVSKLHSTAEIMDVYNQGQRIFGENKVQELVPKYEELPKDIKWHFIGHLQKNKVKYIAPFIAMIHGVESLDLLKEIDKRAAAAGRVVDFLFQMHIAQEETKFGLSERELLDILNHPEFATLKNVRPCGLMGMATLTEDEETIRGEFGLLHLLFKKVKSAYFANSDAFKELSMGMSGDYEIAIEEGSTMVRLGTVIFGERDYDSLKSNV